MRDPSRVWAHAWCRSATATAIFAVIAVGFFNPIFRSNATFSVIAGHQSIQYPWAAHPTGFPDSVQSDQANYVYPIQIDASRSLSRQLLSSWTPASFAGLPTAGSAYSSLPYPGHVLTLELLSASWAHDIFLLLHVWLAGCCMFWLLRILRMSWLAAVFGGVTWMLCPAWFGLIQLEGPAVLAALLPASLALGLTAVRTLSWAWTAACAITGALLILGASIQAGVFCLLIVGAAMTFEGALVAPRGRRLKRVGINLTRAFPATILPLGLVAFVLVPEDAAIALSHRARIPYSVMVDQLGLSAHHVGSVISANVPVLTGNTIWTLLFIGWAGGALVLVGLVSRRQGAWLGRSLALAFMAILLGTPATWLAYHLIPGFPYIAPIGRVTPYAAFGGVILAAIGADVVLGLIRRLSRRELPSVVLGVALIGLQVWQLAPFDRGVNAPFQPRTSAFLFPETPMIGALASDRGHSAQRMIPIRLGAPTGVFFPPPLVGNIPMLFDVDSIGGYFNAIPARSVAVARLLSGEARTAATQPIVGAFGPFFYSHGTRYDLLERFGVGTIVSAPTKYPDPDLTRAMRRLGARLAYNGTDGAVYRLPSALPRAFFVSASQVVPGATEALSRYTDASFPYRTTVLLDGGSPSAAAGVPARFTRVQLSRLSNEQLRLRVRAPRAGWVVVLDTWADGWSATVGGMHVPIERADYAYRAVKVPIGTSTIEMHYNPPGLALGFVISGVSWLIVMGLLIFEMTNRRRRLGRAVSACTSPTGRA
jgi:hypothetical protein